MKIILGIDPGYDRLGLCVLEKKDNNDQKIIFSNCLTSDKKKDINIRIFELVKEIKKIILKYKPTELAIEKLFFTSNQKTVMGVSEARGAIIYLALESGLNIYEYTPLQIKIALTGYGVSTKEQVYFMLQKILKLDKTIGKKLDDESDAIAIAYTHAVSIK